MRRIYLVAFILILFSSCENAGKILVDHLLCTKDDLKVNTCSNEETDIPRLNIPGNFYRNNLAILNSCNYPDSFAKKQVQVTSAEGNFRIKFPYTPKQEADKRYIDDAEINTTIYSLDIVRSGLNDNNLVYSISYTRDIKMTYYHSFDGYVKAQIAGNIRDAHVQLRSDKKLVTRKGAEGRDQVYTLKGTDIQIRYRIILYKNVVYTLSVATGKEHLNNPQASDFFNSFEFIRS